MMNIRKIKLKILEMVSFVPDSTMIKLQYRIKLKRKLNLNNPQRYSDKIQWYKLFYRNEDMIRCSDKSDVRSFVSERGLEHILNDCYGVFENSNSIPFDTLPDSFVIKDTLGSGGNSVLIIKDKKTVDLNRVKCQVDEWIKRKWNIPNGGREWPYYSGKKPRIIVEKYLKQVDGKFTDYKFFCFNGTPKVLYALVNEGGVPNSGKCAFFDMSFSPINVYRSDYQKLYENIEKPINFDLMIEYASVLSRGFPHVRVDFYNFNGEIIFGELTFFNASGYVRFIPDEYDY